MKLFVSKFFSLMNKFVELGEQSHRRQSILLMNSSYVAEQVAFMLDGQWDRCNGVVVGNCDEVAVSTAVSLVGAQWCYSGASVTLLPRLCADELLKRYAAGERDFSNANLRGVTLDKLNLSGANLSWAKLNGTNLRGTNLSQVVLSKAELTEADLTEANLERANLRGAKVTAEQLTLAESLEGAILPDGLKHDQ